MTKERIHRATQCWMKALPFFLLALLPFFVACSEEDNEAEEYVNWQSVNESYWSSLYATTQQKIASGDTSWKLIPSYGYSSGATLSPENYIIVHVLEEGSGTQSPLFTDTVRVNYQGRLLPSTTYTAGKLFDYTWSGTLQPATANPGKFAVSSVVTGFATALQKMHIGDRWMVYIPYQLGYGTSDTSSSGSSSSIPAYSTLIFDLSLVRFWHVGDSESSAIRE